MRTCVLIVLPIDGCVNQSRHLHLRKLYVAMTGHAFKSKAVGSNKTAPSLSTIHDTDVMTDRNGIPASIRASMVAFIDVANTWIDFCLPSRW